MGGYKKMEVGKVNVLYVTTDPEKIQEYINHNYLCLFNHSHRN